ncbi:SPOR domain-containing protein [Asticcacaulis sp. AC402]|uniref:SPOR domain-containing protein n=1 Tax=Asticcacaulis sp. AC402 TaxID=1282361 RepID=UPI0004CE10AF|nr:SPOR domain-containing protein [Asticcacaulis sp. AC402]
MLDKDRGTYSPPTEDNLSYESRRTASRDQAPLTLIISGIVLVIVLLAAVLFYNSSLSKSTRIPTEVGETLGEFRDDKVTDAKVLNDSDMADGEAVFAPSAETPTLRDSAASVEANLAPPPVTPIEGPLPSQQTPADTTPVPGAVAKPEAKPDVKSTGTQQPVASTGSTSVQIGAFDSQEKANAEYNKVASNFGLFVGGAGKSVQKVETERGTFYRTAFTGLSAEKARSFCAALKSAGRDCIVR